MKEKMAAEHVCQVDSDDRHELWTYYTEIQRIAKSIEVLQSSDAQDGCATAPRMLATRQCELDAVAVAKAGGRWSSHIGASPPLTSRKPQIHDHFPVTIYVLVIEV
jgi:hypothetical protein